MITDDSRIDIELRKLHLTIKFDSSHYFSTYLSEIFNDLYTRIQVQPSQSSSSSFSSQAQQPLINLRTFHNYFKAQSYIGEKIFNSMDDDNDGWISRSDFINGMVSLYQGDSREASEFVFGVFDFNKDDKIIKKDVELLMAYIPNQGTTLQHQMKALEENNREIAAFFKQDPMTLTQYIQQIDNNQCESIVKILRYLFEIKPFTLDEVNMMKYKKRKTSIAMKNTPSVKSGNCSFMKSPEKKTSCMDVVSNSNGGSNFTLQIGVYNKENDKEEEPSTPHSPIKKKNTMGFMNTSVKFSSAAQDITQTPMKTHVKNKMSSSTLKFDSLKETMTPGRKPAHIRGKSLNNINLSTARCINSINISPIDLSSKTNRLDDGYPSEFFLCDATEKDESIEDWIFKQDDNSKINNVKKYYVVLQGKSLLFFSTNSKSELLFLYNINSCFIKGGDSINLNRTTYYPITIRYNLTKFNEKVLYFPMESTRRNWLKAIKDNIGNKDIGDYYTLHNKMGEGRFGIVQKGTNIKTNQPVAVKIISKPKLKEKDYELIMKELSIMQLVNHPNLVKMCDYFESEDNIYLVMEILEGGDLITLTQEQDKQVELSEKEVAKIIKSIALGLQYLSKFGLVHRDLKPENIMLGKKGDFNLVKIIDFGLTKTLAYGETVSDPMGTINYVAPEVLRKKPYDHKVDMWSLGIILYLLLGAALPFDDEKGDETIIGKKIAYSEQEYSKEYFGSRSKGCIALIDKCLEKTPSKRITIDAFLEDSWLKAYSN